MTEPLWECQTLPTSRSTATSTPAYWRESRCMDWSPCTSQSGKPVYLSWLACRRRRRRSWSRRSRRRRKRRRSRSRRERRKRRQRRGGVGVRTAEPQQQETSLPRLVRHRGGGEVLAVARGGGGGRGEEPSFNTQEGQHSSETQSEEEPSFEHPRRTTFLRDTVRRRTFL